MQVLIQGMNRTKIGTCPNNQLTFNSKKLGFQSWGLDLEFKN